MLRIKKEVDLKELEKFEFKYVFIINQEYYKKSIIKGIEINNYIVGEDRIIHYNQMSKINTFDNTLYDLINAGLVEKGDDK